MNFNTRKRRSGIDSAMQVVRILDSIDPEQRRKVLIALNIDPSLLSSNRQDFSKNRKGDD